MELYALIVFGIAALGGIYMAVKILGGNLAPWSVSLLHAGLGAGGLLLLIAAYLQGSPGIVTPLAILVAAALGGFLLASYHLRKALPPKAIVVVHALAAVAGVLTLIPLALG
ncbi:hypothetical protein [Sphingorhabdus sp. EL138]|uniref:hypothetical protein n=1 Tax=Sphingorhabdus sp. EL138 TaxID=2073156 RepID=UPI001573B146|nr:hypothetical protein [Sphingorhabdus sp. EL138]